jgi:hypothetical protein
VRQATAAATRSATMCRFVPKTCGGFRRIRLSIY